MLRFVVVADSHIRPSDQETVEYPSNALLVRRNEVIVDLCNTIAPAFVVHLGDIVHPLPTEEAHHGALEIARDVYNELDVPIHFVPGNHDVGDKPNAHVAVPAVADENYGPFEANWGNAYSSFDYGDCHFATIDTQVMNSGLAREGQQRSWLEADLQAARLSGQRIFLFTHYPPFVRDPHESEHYDNIGEPARLWFLDLLDTHDVEAVFSGHVHNFLYNTFGATDMYVAPATGFVRPDYAELAAVEPLRENGRDDPAKLGLFVVDITEHGHVTRPVRSHGTTSHPAGLPVDLPSFLDPAWENPIGVTLAHSWASTIDFPTAGLDRFSRKRIRNDATVLALWEARIANVRVPLDDLRTPDVRERMGALARGGLSFTVYSAGVPTDQDRELVLSAGSTVSGWDVNVFARDFRNAIESMDSHGLEIPLTVAPIVPISGGAISAHHFVAAGFNHDDLEILSAFAASDPDHVFQNIAFLVWHGLDVESSVAAAITSAAAIDRFPVIFIQLPRGSESSVFDRDDEVAKTVRAAAQTAMRRKDCIVVLDGFMDSDRGYYPRHSLIDRRFNPRPAFYELISEVSRDRR